MAALALLTRLNAASVTLTACNTVEEKTDASRLHALAVIECISQQPSDTFTAALAGEITPRIHAVQFADSDRTKIIDMMAKKVALKAPRRYMQDYTKIIQFISQREYDAIAEHNQNPVKVLEIIYELMITLGCVNPSENTSRLLTALWLLCSEGYNENRVSHDNW